MVDLSKIILIGRIMLFDARNSLPSLACFFREASGACRSFDTLGQLLADAVLDLGFEHFALLSHADRGRVRIDNYPADWVERIARQPPCQVDPVHEASLAAVSGFEWQAIGSLVPLSRDQRQAMAEARRFGLRCGFTVPTHIRGGPSASCSFVSARPVALTQERMMCAEVIAHHGYAAARRLAGPPRPRPHLSRRERQCIELVARGKSDWEIGRILGLSRETVRTYLKQARARFDVVSRTQLVVLALRDGHIDFE